MHDGSRKSEKLNFFIGIYIHTGSIVPNGPKFAQNCSTFTVFKIIDIFHFWQNSRWQLEFIKIKLFQGYSIQGHGNERVQNYEIIFDF